MVESLICWLPECYPGSYDCSVLKQKIKQNKTKPKKRLFGHFQRVFPFFKCQLNKKLLSAIHIINLVSCKNEWKTGNTWKNWRYCFDRKRQKRVLGFKFCCLPDWGKLSAC